MGCDVGREVKTGGGEDCEQAARRDRPEPNAPSLHLSAMPRFFFHLRECEELIADEVGADFASVEEARRHAEEAARDIVAEKVKTGEVIDGEAIEVALRTGEKVAEVSLRSLIRIRD